MVIMMPGLVLLPHVLKVTLDQIDKLPLIPNIWMVPNDVSLDAKLMEEEMVT